MNAVEGLVGLVSSPLCGGILTAGILPTVQNLVLIPVLVH
jgi:hypothetical protein